MRMLTAGSLAMDIIFQASDLPVDDGFALIEAEETLPGGSAANVTVSAAGYGMDCYQVGVVGDDDLGKKFVASLESSGVNTKFMLEKPGKVTMHTYIIVAPGGRHTIFAHFGNCRDDFDFSEVPTSVLDGVDIFYTDMFNSMIAYPLAKRAHEEGKKVVLNLQSVIDFMEICKTTRGEMFDVLNIADLIIGGDMTIRSVHGSSDDVKIEDVVDELYSEFIPSDGVICTLGTNGAMWKNANGVFHSPSYKVDEVVDTTGAGDAFLGGMLYAHFMEQMSEADALAFANASAGICCEKLGARSQVSADDIFGFQQSHDVILK